jgi:hypothetical protein
MRSRVARAGIAAPLLLVGCALLGCALVGCALVGCAALGWRFGPGFSCADKALFASPPVVVHRGGELFLAWTQGSQPFFFEPDYRARDGHLVFALVSTASSGNLAGRARQMKIEGDDNIRALQRGGAYWWQREPAPDGRLVALKIVEQFPDSAPWRDEN